MKSKEIRDKFVQFFVKNEHHQQIAVPIVNKEDPSLLFVNAGMNPFKNIILGNQIATLLRVVSVQPCLRVSGKHNDLEEVGVDTYHHTLFEMLGNWSFGNYFKKEAIQWAWELLTEVYKLPKDRIYATIFSGDSQDGLQKDHESAIIWSNYLSQDHILPFPKKYNFWEMGEQGPCGPSSEIHIDIRSEEECKAIPAAELVNKDHPQVVEIWNLVFMQYNRQASGKLLDLPHKHIDTGMGFERLAMVLQGKTSNYDTDIFTPFIEKIEVISGKKYNQTKSISIAMRVIADHIRAVAFSIADGQSPSNIKAGYVIRRILRRAIQYGYSHLNIQQPFIYQLVAVLVIQMEGVYENIGVQQHYIEQVIEAEERTFLKTLAIGLKLLNHLNTTKISAGVINGQVVFDLYDTHGFPLDLTLLIAKEQGLTVDEAGFQQALQNQKLRSKKDATVTKADWQIVQVDASVRFVGYDQCIATTSIIQWRTIVNKRGVFYQIVLAETPFYPEGGGQIADIGVIVSGYEFIDVLDVQKEHGLILHIVKQLPSNLKRKIEARVDEEQRSLVTNNHSATHLLQAALQNMLGTHVIQKGAMVTPTLLRFDFAYSSKLSVAQLQEVESIVNQKIRNNISCLEQRSVPIETAKAMGAKALFGEKYGAEVRVITFDPKFSLELCCGTHVKSTGEIGLFKIINEISIGSGVRRIEAITANIAEAFVAQTCMTLTSITSLLKKPKDLVKAVESLVHEKSQLKKQLIAYQTQAIQKLAEELKPQIEKVNGISLLIQEIHPPHVDALRQVVLQYKSHYRYEQIFLVLAARLENKAQIAVLISATLLSDSVQNANDLIRSIAPFIGGKGGGQPVFSTAEGNKPEGINAALKAAREIFLQEYV